MPGLFFDTDFLNIPPIRRQPPSEELMLSPTQFLLQAPLDNVFSSSGPVAGPADEVTRHLIQHYLEVGLGERHRAALIARS